MSVWKFVTWQKLFILHAGILKTLCDRRTHRFCESLKEILSVLSNGDTDDDLEWPQSPRINHHYWVSLSTVRRQKNDRRFLRLTINNIITINQWHLLNLIIPTPLCLYDPSLFVSKCYNFGSHTQTTEHSLNVRNIKASDHSGLNAKIFVLAWPHC